MGTGRSSSRTRRFSRLRDSRGWKIGRWPLAAGALLGVIGVVAIVALYMGVELPEEPPTIESSVVLAADGTELAVLADGERRFEVPLSEISDHVEHALVAAEDRRFHEHNGVDPIGIVRAVWNNVRGGDTQGGSTITQQLVKNVYTGDDRTLGRKVREALLATKLEGRADKSEILEAYLNTVYFGRGAYGIEAAARTYFDASAAQLDPAQSALLVGLLRAPEANDPTEEPDAATTLRGRVLDAMVDTGSLDDAEARAAAASPLGVLPPPEQATLRAGIAPHFVNWVRSEVTARLGESLVYSGGLTIRTTLVPEHQFAAEAAVAQLDGQTDADAALISVDADGDVTAHVGSRDHAAVQVDLARGPAGGGSGRQAGSTFKPFVLAGALSPEVPLGTRYPAPPTLSLDLGGGTWDVSNYGGNGYGEVTLAEATADSVNTVYAQLALDVGIDQVTTAANDAGVTAELGDHPSIALGAAETSPLDMAVAYGTFAQGGRHHAPRVITSVTDGEDQERWNAPDRDEAPGIDEGVAAAVTHALRGVIESGTGTAADIGRPAAGKTGTTQDSGDAWFVGYTPHRSTAVWLGRPEGRQPVTDSSGSPLTGGGLPARTWATFMEAATAEDAPDDFEPAPEELLGEPPVESRTLVLSPTSGEPGTEVTATGTGYAECTNWRITTEPELDAPPAEAGSDAAERSATFTVPQDAEPGQVRVAARCDDGSGEQVVAEATFTVTGAATTTTTSSSTTSSSTTSTTTPDESTTTSTTTTTEPGARGGQGRQASAPDG
jgi:penicillin-binding protein 1A